MTGLRTLLLLLLLCGCALPPMQGFSDAYLMPKWYVSASVFLLFLVNESILLWRGKWTERYDWDGLFRMWSGLVAIVCLYALAVAADRSGPLTGMFDNPAGLALYLTFPTAYAVETVWRCRGSRRYVFVGMLSLILTTVVLSESRTGVLAFIAATGSSFLIRRPCKCRALKGWLLAVLLVLPSVFLFSQKSESTTGRCFILERTFSLIRKQPFTGYGRGGFRKTYMAEQASYFLTHPDDTTSARLADEVSHPLCEFMIVWIDYGIVGLLLFVAVIGIPCILYFRTRGSNTLHTLCGMQIVVCIFSFFSYPFHYPVAWLVVVLTWAAILADGWRLNLKGKRSFVDYSRLVGAGLCVLWLSGLAWLIRDGMYDHAWAVASQKSQQGYSVAMMSRYRAIYSYKQSDPLFLYDYAMEQCYAGRLEQAAQTTERCSRYMSSYNLELLRGDILRCLHQETQAMMHYRQAHRMCPVRFAPLEGMLSVYAARKGTCAEGDSLATMIIDKPVKVWSVDIERIKNKASEYLNQNSYK